MRIVVVGDVLLDVDIDGEATRLCPDAPVPVVDVNKVQRRAGGAGLVARMLAGDGHSVTLVTVLADDDAALHLERALDRDHCCGRVLRGSDARQDPRTCGGPPGGPVR